MEKSWIRFFGRELPCPLRVAGRQVGRGGVRKGSIHNNAHRRELPPLRAAVLRGHEGVSAEGRKGCDIPSRGECGAHAPHRGAHRDGSGAGRDVCRGRREGGEGQHRVCAAVRDGRVAVHPSAADRHRSADRRRTRKGVHVPDDGDACWGILQGWAEACPRRDT